MNKFTIKAPVLAVITLWLLLSSRLVLADEIRVAVASNFADTIREVAKGFENNTGHKVSVISGSTGKHYAQIINGAPFNLFFAADVRRARLLEEEGFIDAGSRFTYALGKLVLWSPAADYIDPHGRVVTDGGFRYLAVANPRLAPYGRAAREVLQGRGVWSSLRGRMVRGENIGQTFQFVSSGNAELGFVSYSQIKRPGQPIKGSFWEVPQPLYSSIEQQAVLLDDNDPARSFLDYVKSDEALEIIRGFGYGIP